MKIIEFFNEFPDESSCKSTFKEYREQQGVKCKKCGNTKHYWLKSKEQYESLLFSITVTLFKLDLQQKNGH